MGKRKHLWEKLAEVTDLKTEPIPKQPLVEIIGERRVLIENHCGIIGYAMSEVCVKVRFGHIQICGNGLELNCMTKDQLVIAGTIECVRLCKGGR